MAAAIGGMIHLSICHRLACTACHLWAHQVLGWVRRLWASLHQVFHTDPQDTSCRRDLPVLLAQKVPMGICWHCLQVVLQDRLLLAGCRQAIQEAHHHRGMDHHLAIGDHLVQRVIRRCDHLIFSGHLLPAGGIGVQGDHRHLAIQVHHQVIPDMILTGLLGQRAIRVALLPLVAHHLLAIQVLLQVLAQLQQRRQAGQIQQASQGIGVAAAVSTARTATPATPFLPLVSRPLPLGR